MGQVLLGAPHQEGLLQGQQPHGSCLCLVPQPGQACTRQNPEGRAEQVKSTKTAASWSCRLASRMCLETASLTGGILCNRAASCGSVAGLTLH